jgi:hypothetical protein
MLLMLLISKIQHQSSLPDISQLPKKYNSQVSPENLSESLVKEVAINSLKSAKEETGFGSNLVLICILAFIAAHAIGQGAVIWVFISEIFPAVARVSDNHLAVPLIGSSPLF